MVAEFLSGQICVHCGRVCHTYMGGYASVGLLPVCHPNGPARPDCYTMITLYRHELRSCARCAQDPYLPLTRQELHDAMLDIIRDLERMVQDALP